MNDETKHRRGIIERVLSQGKTELVLQGLKDILLTVDGHGEAVKALALANYVIKLAAQDVDRWGDPGVVYLMGLEDMPEGLSLQKGFALEEDAYG